MGGGFVWLVADGDNTKVIHPSIHPFSQSVRGITPIDLISQRYETVTLQNEMRRGEFVDLLAVMSRQSSVRLSVCSNHGIVSNIWITKSTSSQVCWD